RRPALRTVRPRRAAPGRQLPASVLARRPREHRAQPGAPRGSGGASSPELSGTMADAQHPGAGPIVPRRLAVGGHVTHGTRSEVAALPQPGDIVHLDAPRWFPGGGGGVAFFQLVRGAAEVHLFTALGNDDAANAVAARLAATPAVVHAARRETPHTRDLVLVT